MNIITSKANNVVKKAKKLHQKKYRSESYLIEGWHLFEEALASQARILRIFALAEYEERLAAFSQTIFVSPEILSDLADSKTPQGIVAELAFEEQNVQDPGNVGTIIRTADAAGYQGVFISSHSADIYNLKTLRSMQGSHFHLPIYRVSREDMLALARQNDLQILASTLSEDSVDYQKVEKNEAFLLVMGNEGQGISQEMTDAADVLVHISMKGQAESLNVAVAAGILMFALS